MKVDVAQVESVIAILDAIKTQFGDINGHSDSNNRVR